MVGYSDRMHDLVFTKRILGRSSERFSLGRSVRVRAGLASRRACLVQPTYRQAAIPGSSARCGAGPITPGCRVLDIGCGTGRWVRRYAQLGFCAAGVDAAPDMLTTARERGTTSPLIAGEASQLPF